MNNETVKSVMFFAISALWIFACVFIIGVTR